MNKVHVNQLAPYRAERHPDFDKFWESHGQLVWWWATRLARIFNSIHKMNTQAEDYVATLTIRLNYCLHLYQEDRGFLFSTYYGVQIYEYVLRELCKDTERWNYRLYATRSDPESKRQERQIKAYTQEVDHRFYMPPDEYDDVWASDFIDFMGGIGEMWDSICKCLDKRLKDVILLRFKHGLTLAQIADDWKLSRERVRQLEVRALDKIRKHVYHLERFRSLFVDDSKVLAS